MAIQSQNGPLIGTEVRSTKVPALNDDAEWQALIELYRDPTPERRQAMHSALSFDYTKYTYVEGACDPELVSPDTYHLDTEFLQRRT